MSDEQDDSLDSLERLSAGTGLRGVPRPIKGINLPSILN